jgi:hypothetical protein
MSTVNRREVLRSLLTGALRSAGTVVLACSALPAALAQGNQLRLTQDDLRQRADELASEEGVAPAGPVAWGGFRRGGFANGGGGGGFRRGGFGNGYGGGGGFRRGGFRNGW